jgi:hypothetical protein
MSNLTETSPGNYGWLFVVREIMSKHVFRREGEKEEKGIYIREREREKFTH